MSGGLSSVSIDTLDGLPNVAWARGLEVSVPQALATWLRDYGDQRPAVELPDRSDAAGAIDSARLQAAYTPSPPASSRLPVSYQFVPLRIRTAIGHAIARMKRRRSQEWASYPRWPLDLSADFIADVYGQPSPFAGEPSPVLISHDLDTPEGLNNLVQSFLPLEEAAGAKSSNYIVPCAWPIDHGLLGEVRSRGHEIGIHGYDHSNRTPFAEAQERRRRIEAARPLIERYAVIGYRAPSLLRTKALLSDLAELYRYDTSIPTSGGLFPVPNNGCASARPFTIGKLVEIPLTMPRDGSLLFLGHSPAEILAMWKECAQRIAASGGIISLLTHCEQRFSGHKRMLHIYREFLEHLGSDRRYVFRKPSQILDRVALLSIEHH